VCHGRPPAWGHRRSRSIWHRRAIGICGRRAVGKKGGADGSDERDRVPPEGAHSGVAASGAGRGRSTDARTEATVRARGAPGAQGDLGSCWLSLVGAVESVAAHVVAVGAETVLLDAERRNGRPGHQRAPDRSRVGRRQTAAPAATLWALSLGPASGNAPLCGSAVAQAGSNSMCAAGMSHVTAGCVPAQMRQSSNTTSLCASPRALHCATPLALHLQY
jgi:hypothetical protein